MTPEEKKEKHREYMRVYREKRRERMRDWHREYQEKNAERIANIKARNEKHKQKRAQQNKKRRAVCADSYIAERLKMPVKEIPHDLIEAKREHLLTYRCIKQLETTIKEKS